LSINDLDKTIAFYRYFIVIDGNFITREKLTYVAAITSVCYCGNYR